MIVVTTPTGAIGRQVVERLLERGEPIRVIARDPSRLPDITRDRVEVVTGSHGDARTVTEAFEGADAVFWLAPPDPTAQRLEDPYTEFVRPACEALRALGVPRVVGVTALGRGVTGDAGYVTASLAMDDLLAASGAAYRGIAAPSFMDNVLRQVEAIRAKGVLVGTLSPGLKLPVVATRDIAATAVDLLLDDTWTGHETVPVLGPEDLSQEDLAQVLSEVLDRPVRYQQVPVEGLRATLLERGTSPAMAEGMIAMMVAKENGLDSAQKRTPEATTPTSFRTWCEDVLVPAV